MLAKPEYAQAILDYLGVDIELPAAPAAPVEPPDPPVEDSADDGQSPNDIPDRETTPPVNDDDAEPTP